MSNKWELLQLFSSEGSFLIVNKLLLQKLGPEKALFISNLIDKYRYFLQQDKIKDDWFFQSHIVLDIVSMSCAHCVLDRLKR